MLVSIVIPAYNAEATLARTLDSVLQQSYAEIEIVVVDDGSTDETKDILKTYAERDERIKFVSQKNSGQASARNRAIRLSAGEYVALIDADDVWGATKIEKQAAFLEQHDDIGLVYTDGYTIADNDRRMDPIGCSKEFTGDCFERLAIENNIVASSVLLRRSVLEDVGLFREELRAAENWNLWFRVSAKYKLAYIDEELTFYRRHESNMTGDKSHMLRNRLNAIELNFEMVSQYRAVPRSLKKLSLYTAYASFGRAYLGDFEFVEARGCFWNALKINPLDLKLYGWLFQTFLGSGAHQVLRKFKRAIFQPK